MAKWLKRIGEWVLANVYPEPIAWRHEDEWREILRQLPYTEQLYVRGNITEDLFRSQHRVRRAGAMAWYDHRSPVRRLLRRGKFGQSADPEVITRLAHELGEQMLESGFSQDIALIIPMPLHKRRLRERGFNQTDYIAAELSRVLGVPWDGTNLVRTRDNPHQALLDKSAREENVRELFMLERPQDVRDKHVLLVDDIITTGETMRSAVRAFGRVRGVSISIAALAKAR